ncbi:hypothetical protein [Halobacillus yeomjeoni]|uniref:Uncharacterized protein n=1 Tax=Halobacillus yeomjeoni TaxID=311194 RepID=A0A931MVI9_9BACI|nr:hypothetical protein [Halobacillus yeomjeoni]MBH0230384.1 hypothetical protein [Halobacillus yeomjeoni]
MWSSIAIFLIGAGIFLFQFKKLHKNKKMKELWWSSSILVATTFISILESRGVDLPNPLDYIWSFYSNIHSWFGF